MEGAVAVIKRAVATSASPTPLATTHTPYGWSHHSPLFRQSQRSLGCLVLQRDFTNATPAIGPEAASDESNRRRSCGAADKRSTPGLQADPARVGARQPARASGPERRSVAERHARPGWAAHLAWARDAWSSGAKPPSLWFRRCCQRTRRQDRAQDEKIGDQRAFMSL